MEIIARRIYLLCIQDINLILINLLSAKENYKTLEKSSQRALIYQKMLLTVDQSEKLYLARLLKICFRLII